MTTTTTSTTTSTTTTPAPVVLGARTSVIRCQSGLPTSVCTEGCEWIFDRLIITPGINGGTTVQWNMHPQFDGFGPLTFHLQVGSTGNPNADDWLWIAGPVVDTYLLTDPDKRLYGRYPFTHYRVVVQTATGDSYASKPYPIFGRMDKRDWLQAKEVMRGETVRFKMGAGMKGKLLKRRLSGDICTCVDSMTQESRDPDCTSCYGTGFIGGYYDPYECFWVEDTGNSGFRSHNSDKGTTNDGHIMQGRCLNQPAVFSYDVWVEDNTDDRWIFHTIRSVVHIRGVEIVMVCEMRRAPYNHVIYKFPV